MAAIEEDKQDQDTAIRTGQPKITVPLTPGEEGSLTVTGRQPALQVRPREGPDGTDPELIVRVREVGLPTVSMQVEIWVSSLEPAVGVCTPAGTW
jgi:hypothetical protein